MAVSYSKWDILNKYTHITDVSPYFKKIKNKMIFVGKTLEVVIPRRYDVYQLLTIGKTIETLGVVDLIIDGKYRSGLLLLATIEIENKDYKQFQVDEVPYISVTLTTGDIFIYNTTRPKQNKITQSIFVEFVMRGKTIYWLANPNDIVHLFETSNEVTGANIRVDQVIFEVLYSHLFRDPHNPYILYRRTDQKEPAHMIGLREINVGADSTTAKIAGSYFGKGLNSALINQSTEHSQVEDLLRA